ncbi:zinc-binding metallopeptidase family protein [Minwuia thermotolerans]|uniref:zinc-binding metallopeptidase family protein n=1 Tax=Minwuia thermotolerans TaxID=2056226 RepID=UPI0013DE3E53|nr:putative zinc-binding metallopeptidase [Minwuia thermotolerans]
MHLFTCPACGGRLFFRNLTCACGASVVFDPEAGGFATDGAECANRAEIACNWLARDGGLCRSCAMTEVVPETFHGENRGHWQDAELAKRWVLANLARWGWLTGADPGPRPVFHMLAEAMSGGAQAVSMGHKSGIVTINVTEADDVMRVRRREDFDEPLRTMIGHFRHELGHFFFERLAVDNGFPEGFRALFADERIDYGAALNEYYRQGPYPGWEGRHITAYAASHPHEDWAESFAHLLHLTDIVDSFAAAGLTGEGLPTATYDAYAEQDAATLLAYGARLGVALNHVNRAMGISDIYPFVHTPAIAEKLRFVHRWMARGLSGTASADR